MAPASPPRLAERALGFGARGVPARPTSIAPRSIGARLPLAPPAGDVSAHAGPARAPAERAELPVGAWSPAPGFHGAVTEFKRRLIEATLTQQSGNRTRAARALGLQRTYLLRLMREFEIKVPAVPGHPRREPEGQISPPTRAG
jgi:DNA-binding NtrC family response regulator